VSDTEKEAKKKKEPINFLPVNDRANAVLPSAALGKVIEWKDGKPIPVTKPILSKDKIANIAQAAISLEYREEDDVLGIDKEYYGLSIAEVLFIKMARSAASTGDIKVISALLDRVLGKPKQEVESKNLNMTYQDFLEQLARNEGEVNGNSEGEIIEHT
jgi:hypothetical protein